MSRGLRKLHTDSPFPLPSSFELDRETVLTFCQLSKTGIVLLEYLTRYGYVYKGKFLLNVKDFLDKTNLRSKKSFYLGIDNLVKWQVLAKTEELGFFYFNKKFFPDYDSSSKNI